MKLLTIIPLITMISACSATETLTGSENGDIAPHGSGADVMQGTCPPNDQWIEPGAVPFTCPDLYPVDPKSKNQSRDILQPYPT